MSSQAAERQLHLSQRKINDFEDVVLTFEREKADWVKRMEAQRLELQKARSERQEFEAAALAQESIILNIKAQTHKLVSHLKARDSEIEQLRSRENKTVVEHVHVLEKAKRVTDRELAQALQDKDALATLAKSLDQQKARLQGDLEDATRQMEILRKRHASPSPASSEALALAEEKAARRQVEDQVKQLQTEVKNLSRKLETSKGEVDQLSEHIATSKSSASQNRLLQELQHNNERLQQQMTDAISRDRSSTPSKAPSSDGIGRLHKRSLHDDDRDAKTHGRSQSANFLGGVHSKRKWPRITFPLGLRRGLIRLAHW